jgi:hypothetical protein
MSLDDIDTSFHHAFPPAALPEVLKVADANLDVNLNERTPIPPQRLRYASRAWRLFPGLSVVVFIPNPCASVSIRGQL